MILFLFTLFIFCFISINFISLLSHVFLDILKNLLIHFFHILYFLLMIDSFLFYLILFGQFIILFFFLFIHSFLFYLHSPWFIFLIMLKLLISCLNPFFNKKNLHFSNFSHGIKLFNMYISCLLVLNLNWSYKTKLPIKLALNPLEQI